MKIKALPDIHLPDFKGLSFSEPSITANSEPDSTGWLAAPDTHLPPAARISLTLSGLCIYGRARIRLRHYGFRRTRRPVTKISVKLPS